MKSTVDLIPARILNEFVYCPRLAYLEWVQGDFEHNVYTLEGRFQHRNVDKESTTHPSSSGFSAGDSSTPVHERSLTLSSPSEGLIARMDLVEIEGRRARPVDYKRGHVPENDAMAFDPERVQLCAQGLILRDNGYECDEGFLYFTGSKTRIRVPFDDDLVAFTRLKVRELGDTAEAGTPPLPLVDSPKCPKCSLVGICLPDEIHALRQEDEGTPRVRALAAPRDLGKPLYVVEQGARIGRSGANLEVKKAREVLAKAHIAETSQVSLIGNVQITTQAVRALAQNGIPVCHFSYGGWFTAITTGMQHKNVELRMRQFAMARDREKSLDLARAFTRGKIRNSRTFLRRNHAEPPPEIVRSLAQLADQARHAESSESLLGIEGLAARKYFSEFSGMLKTGQDVAFDFQGRNRRPPRDPVNALLSFAYGLLVKEMTVVCLAAGFDPYLGFYHRPKYGRPALALDLAEEFRPILADSTVVTVLNNAEIRPEDFVVRQGACALKPAGRKRFLGAWERRLNTSIRHPRFNYSMSYRKIFSVQVRLLGRHLQGELSEYPSFVTR